MYRTLQSYLFASIYDIVIEPVERLGLGGLRRETLWDLSGDVLELGVGTGRSLAAYPSTVTSVTGIDPDEKMLARATGRAQRAGVPARTLLADAEDLPFPDGRFDVVTAFLTLCTVRDQEAALREARRVLTPGGRLRLLWSTCDWSESLSDACRRRSPPAWKKVAGGCHLDRRTLDSVKVSGFNLGRVERHLSGLVLEIHAWRPV